MPAGFHVASAWVDIHAEDAGLRGEIQNAVRSAVAGADAKVKLEVDAGALRAKVEAALSGASAGSKGEVKLDLDAASLRAKVESAIKGAAAGAKGKVALDLDTNALRGKVSAAVAAAGAGQKVKVGIDVDRSSFQTAESAIRSVGQTADRVFGGGGGGGGRGLLGQRSGLGSLSIGGLLPILSMLEPALGALIAPAQAVATASAALVPAFMGAVVGAAALVVGTRGVGIAMKASQGDATKYGESLNNLAPAAQDFVRSVSGFGGAFAGMKLPVQEALFNGLGQKFQEMATGSIPTLTGGLAGMGAIMNTAFKGVLNTVQKLNNDGVLGQMFGGLQTAFKPLANIPGQMVNMLAKISTAASPLLAQITKGIGGAFSGMNDKINKSFEDGRLQNSITRAGQSVKEFFNNFKDNGAVQGFLANMKQMGPAAAQSLQKIGEAGLTLLNSGAGVGAALLKIGGAAATLVNAVPPALLQNVMMLAGGFKLMNLAGAGVAKVSGIVKGLGTALTGLGGGQVVQRQAAGLTALATAGGRANAALAGGALSANAIRAQAAAMGATSIAVQGMSPKLAQAGTGFITLARGATGAIKPMAALKAGGIALGATFLAMKGVDSISEKIFGKPATVTEMAKGFQEFNATGKLSGVTARTLGDNFGKFGDALGKVAHNDALGKIGNSLARGFAWTGLDAFKDKNKDLVNSVDDTLASLVKAGHADVAKDIFGELGKSAEKNGTSVKKLRSTLGDYGKALKEQKVVEQIAAKSMGTFGQEAIKTQKILGANKGEVQGLAGSYNALGRFNSAAVGSQLNYNQSVSQAGELMKKHTNALTMQNGVLNTTKPAAQQAAGAMLNIAEAAKKSGEAMTGKGDFAQAAKGYESARKQIEALGRAQGLTAAQAKEFTNQIMPADTAKMYAKDIDMTAASIKKLGSAMQGKPNQKLFNFDANQFQSTARAALESVGASVKTLGNGKMQVKVDTAEAKSKVESLGKVFEGMGKGVKNIKLPMQDVAGVAKAMQAAGMKVQKIGDAKFKITAEDGTTTVIEGVKKKKAELEKPVKIPKLAIDPKGDAKTTADGLRAQAKALEDNGKAAETASVGGKKYNVTLDGLNKLIRDGKMQGHGKGPGGFGAGLAPSTEDMTKFQKVTDMFKQFGGAGKGNVQVGVMISGTEQIDKLKALNEVNNKIIQVAVNVSGTEDIEKLKTLNAVDNKNIQVAVNVSGTEDIEKLKTLNDVDNKIVQVAVNISGTEDIEKLKELNNVNNKIVQVSVNISGTEDIEKLKELNNVNNKNVQVAVNISGTEDIEKLKELNNVNNKSVQVAVNVSGTENLEKLKELNNVNNKSIQVSVNVSGVEGIEKLKTLNQVNNKSIQVSVNVAGVEKLDKLKELNNVNNKSIQVSVNVSGVEKLDKLKELNNVNNKSVQVSVNVTGVEKIDKLKELNNVQNKNISVNCNIQGAENIDKLKGLNDVQNKTVSIAVNVTGADQAQTLKSSIAGITNKNVTVTVTANPGPIQQVKSALQGLNSKSVTVTVSANAGPINAVKTALAGINSKSVSVTVSANAGPINALKTAIAGVNSKSVTVTATAPTGPVTALKSAISSVQGKSVTVTANVNGLGAVQALIGAIAAVQSKTVTVTVHTRKTGSAAGGGHITHESIPGMARGGRSMLGAGPVTGIGTGTSDSILTWLSNGEFVVRASMVEKYGTGLLSAINNGAFGAKIQGFSSGGGVSLGNVQPGDHNNEVLLLQQALKSIYPNFDYSSGPGTFGPRTQATYSAYQRSLGYSGGDADGAPGIKSLTALASRTGVFTVQTMSNVQTYLIKWGDTLTSIARRFNTTVAELVRLNGIQNANLIYAGQTLKIPGHGSGGHPTPIPGVVPGTLPGDANYLPPPHFSKAPFKTESDGDKKPRKEVSAVDDLKVLVASKDAYFSRGTNTNANDLYRKIMDATDTTSLASALDTMRKSVWDAFADSTGETALQKYLEQGGNILTKNQQQADKLVKSMEDAKKNLDDMNASFKQLNESVVQSIVSFATLTKTGKLGANAETMIREMTKDTGKSAAFGQQIEALRLRGLNGDTLSQIASSGVVDGSHTAASLLQATPEQIAQINALQAQVLATAGKAGNTAATAMYGAGVAIAQGIVDGIKSQQTAIDEVMKKIAEAMKLAIKQTMGIASPSKVTHGYGVNIVEGLRQGIWSEKDALVAKVKALAEQIVFMSNGSITPSVGVPSGTIAGGSAGGNVIVQHLEVNVNGAGFDLTNPAQRKALVKTLGKEIMDEIREQSRKRI